MRTERGEVICLDFYSCSWVEQRAWTYTSDASASSSDRALSTCVADLPTGLLDTHSTLFSLVRRLRLTRPADKLVSSLLCSYRWSMRWKWELFGSLSCCWEWNIVTKAPAATMKPPQGWKLVEWKHGRSLLLAAASFFFFLITWER